MTAEEIFNMFFGGGFPSQTVYTTRGGRFQRQAHFQRHFNAQNHEQQREVRGKSV